MTTTQDYTPKKTISRFIAVQSAYNMMVDNVLGVISHDTESTMNLNDDTNLESDTDTESEIDTCIDIDSEIDTDIIAKYIKSTVTLCKSENISVRQNYSMSYNLLGYANTHLATINALVLQYIDSLQHIDNVTHMILIIAVSELQMNITPAKVIISEYTNIAAMFFDDSVTAFVNAVLDKIALKQNAEIPISSTSIE